MAWSINCNNPSCGQTIRADNIVELINNHVDEAGWFVCRVCNNHGHIKKSFDLQEPGETWDPFLRGVISLGELNDTYQPFVFLVSYEHDGPVTDIWVSYYKDLRRSGGNLKLGYGPGGPPVLGTSQLLSLLKQLLAIGCVSKESIENIFNGTKTA